MLRPLIIKPGKLIEGCSLRKWEKGQGELAAPLSGFKADQQTVLRLYFQACPSPQTRAVVRFNKIAGAFVPATSKADGWPETSTFRSITNINAVGLWRRAWLVQLILRPRRWSKLVKF